MLIRFNEQDRKLLMRAFERSITYASQEEAQAVVALRLRILKQRVEEDAAQLEEATSCM